MVLTTSVVFTAFCALLLIGELAVRLAFWTKLIFRRKPRPVGQSQTFRDAYEDPQQIWLPSSHGPKIDYNTYLGFIPRPNVKRSTYSTNRYSFRYDEDFPAEKEPNEIRIFVTGGSKAWGAGVPQSALYTNLIEQHLAKTHRGLRIRVICAAVSAYCSTQERIMIENLILPLSPDYIVMFSGRNDCYFGFLGQDIMLRQDYFEFEKILAPDKFRDERPRYNSFKSKLHFLFRRVIYGLKNSGQKPVLTPASVQEEQLARSLMTNIHIISDLSRRYGFKLIYYLEPSIFTTRKTLTSWERSVAARTEKRLAQFREYNQNTYRILREKLPGDAARNGYVFIDGDDAIKNEVKSVFADNVHFGDRGDRLVGEHLSGVLEKIMSSDPVLGEVKV